ncbi:hypothetical protein BKA66DRAFT_608294 [Pyrenochaeta sp. MPI-SDFR-AT-0127]|nr:hypothetical protein BKA66DRAFT_608294 [Pyrenochaeta sp. MPI-SDFR-AT-0127]
MSNSLLATGTESIHEWSRSRLQAIFRQLSVLDPTQTKFCFFVDGLDEYNGDYDDLIGTLRSLINPNVKLCISSRPLNVFEQSFWYNPQYKIYMEDLNAKDIQQYVKDNLTTRSDFKALQMDIFEAARISNEILSKSQGVFLWVALVVRSLIDGLRNRDIFSLLFKRLHDFPADLEDYFRNIFDSLDPFYKTLSAHMFKVALASHSPLHLLVYWFLDALEDDSAMALTMSIKALTQQEITSHIEEVKVRINGRCKGLLEVNKHSIGANPAVDFLHRSVTDWLKTAEMEKMLSTWQCGNFNAHLYICKASLAALKSASTTLSDHGSGHIMLCDCFLRSAKGVEDAMNESPIAYIDTFEHTISEHIRSRPNISSPWLSWYSTNLLSVAARLDLKLFVKDRLSQESKRTTSDNGFSKKLKMEMLRGVPEDQPLTGVSPSPEMMEIILPVGPSVVFDQTLQSSLCSCIPVKGLDRNRVISIIEFICKHCIFEASKSGVPVNKQLVKMLDGFLFENQLEEVYNTIRRGNRWHNNPVRRLWRLVDRSES